jgi:2-polyprenyl-6-methoxyphenol hydroxylase-like FAD-dependent oxidoreductase
LRIAIAGAGIAGAYLFLLLAGSGNGIDLFDIKNGTKCGMSPCAWGTSMDFFEL